jgi:hypothetical protein
MTEGITFSVSGEDAAYMQSYINSSLQNPPAYELPYSDCATWVQQVLGNAGISSGPPTALPTTLIWQIQQAIP